MNPAEFLLSTTVGQRFLFAPGLPSADWTHLAIEVRADGVATLHVNRRLIGEAPVHITDLDAKSWRILVFGEAVDTRMYVRILVLWPGSRDRGVPGDIPGNSEKR